MNNNDNIEDFFKNQLNRFDEPMEDWEKPDVDDWENISSQVPLFTKTAFWTASNISLVSLGTVLVCSMLYIWKLNKHVTTLEQQIQVQNQTIQEVNKTIEIINEKQINKTIIIEEENEVLKQQNKVIQTQNQLLKSITTQQQSTISTIQKANKESNSFERNALNQRQKEEQKGENINPSFNKNNGNDANNPQNNKAKITVTIPIAENTTTKEDNNENPSTNPKDNLKQTTIEDESKQALAYLASAPTEAVMDKQTYQFSKLNTNFDYTAENSHRQRRLNIVLPIPIGFDGIQVGYEYRLQSMVVDNEVNVNGLTIISEEMKKEEQFIPIHGLTVDIPLTKNWSIQTGARYSYTFLDLKTYSTGIYNTDNEYTLPDGTIARDLNITQTTPFSSANSEVQFTMEADRKFEDGEVFTLFSEWEQDQQMLQIPLGLAYQFGEKKLSWSLGAGIQWNKIWYDRYHNEFKLYKDESEEMFRADVLSTDFITKKDALSYLSSYASAGLQYQFLKNLSINATVAANYNFFEKATEREPEFSNIDGALSIGFKYHF